MLRLTLWKAAAVAASLFTLSQAGAIIAQAEKRATTYNLYGYATEFAEGGPYVVYELDSLAYLGSPVDYTAVDLTFNDTLRTLQTPTGEYLYIDTATDANAQVGFTASPTSDQTYTNFYWYGTYLMWESSDGELNDPFWGELVDDLYPLFYNEAGVAVDDNFPIVIKDSTL